MAALLRRSQALSLQSSGWFDPGIGALVALWAAIAIGGLAGTQTVTRKVTNVDDAAATYTAAVTSPAGCEVSWIM